MMSSADGTKGRCPLDSRPSRGAPLRGERQGAALHPRLCGEHQRALPSGLPLGLKPQAPRCCASPLRLRAGRGWVQCIPLLRRLTARQNDRGPQGGDAAV